VVISERGQRWREQSPNGQNSLILRGPRLLPAATCAQSTARQGKAEAHSLPVTSLIPPPTSALTSTFEGKKFEMGSALGHPKILARLIPVLDSIMGEPYEQCGVERMPCSLCGAGCGGGEKMPSHFTSTTDLILASSLKGRRRLTQIHASANAHPRHLWIKSI
jgi:hypothetical protein